MISTIAWKDNSVVMIDQRKLPLEEEYVVCKDYKRVIWAIKELVIRGAPAIGIAAAMGLALGALEIRTSRSDSFCKEFDTICHEMASARPTAINLFWAIDRMKRLVSNSKGEDVKTIKALLVSEAQKILAEDISVNRRLGNIGQKLLKDGACVLTHCNAGALATGGYGTALGVIRAAVENGKKISVFADETRPFLQGARLTAWELKQASIPVTLITDSMAGHFMQRGRIEAVIVGADRITVNGDVANKIGTYMIAVLASIHRIPFYVAAPISTIDCSLESGDKIPIEERDRSEVTHILGKQIAPNEIMVENPAFDVTPNQYVTAIITEKGIATPPFKESLARLEEE
nr:S-methyl-5-thioribose-1-phosphate isomerase [Desulfobacterales bacterium]